MRKRKTFRAWRCIIDACVSELQLKSWAVDGKLDIYGCTINLIVIHRACITNLWPWRAALALCFPVLSCVRAQRSDFCFSDILILMIVLFLFPFFPEE